MGFDTQPRATTENGAPASEAPKSEMNALPCTIYVSFIGALLAAVAGRWSAVLARWIALLAAIAGLGLALHSARAFEPGAHFDTIVNLPWIAELGIRYHLAADGISLTLVLLTGLAATAGVLFSWNVEDRVGEFFALYLALIGGVYGVFLSADAFLLFVFYEIAIVPKYFLIAKWGSTNREYGAMKLVLYSFAGSALVLIGLLWAYAASGQKGFGLTQLAGAAANLGLAEQLGLFGLLFFGFAVLAGLFPFHTWAPTGHVAAPTAASMLLAGVVMKLGAYGCLRVAMATLPAAFSYWQPWIAALAIVGIIYAGCVALVQDDFKFVIGYSSVSHMGFVLLGLAAGNTEGLAGAVLQMFSHGIIAGLLFGVVGRLVYDRTHTRQMDALRRIALHRMLPFAAVVFVVAGMASMGMPGFSGFPAELTILIGAWKTSPIWAIAAATGVIIAGAFTLRAVHVAFFGRAGRVMADPPPPPLHSLPPITWPERIGTLLLVAATVYIGLAPDTLLNWIWPALEAPALQAIIQGGAP